MSGRYRTVHRLLFFLMADVLCLFAFVGTIYTAMTQGVTPQTLPPMNAPAEGTETLTPTLTLTLTGTLTSVATKSLTPPDAATPTEAATESPVPSPTVAASATATPEPATTTATPTATITPTDSTTPTESAPTATATTEGTAPPPETVTATPPDTPTATPTSTDAINPTATETPTLAPTEAPTLVPAETPTNTVTQTPTSTETPTATPTETLTLTPTETSALSNTLTPTATETPTAIIDISPTVVISFTPTITIPPPPNLVVRPYAYATPNQSPLLAIRAPSAIDPHGGYSTATSSCAACHRTHTASGSILRTQMTEESVCFACHRASGASNPYPGTNVQPAFTSYVNTVTGFYVHDVASTNGVHRVNETAGSQFEGANRHVECEDCHEPHAAARGAASAPFLQREMSNVSGVDPTYMAAGGPASYTFMPQAQREYQVCFKCHSSYTALPTYPPDGWDGAGTVPGGLRKLTSTDALQVPDTRDMARAFNPYNTSYHPVVAQGANQAIPAGSWTAGSGMWQTSMIFCSSCHTNANAPTQGKGPHGSPNLHILGGGANYSTSYVNGRWPNAQEICFQCHNYATYAGGGAASTTNFRDGSENLHSLHVGDSGGTCYMCHNSHGSEQAFLINFDLTVVTPGMGRNSVNAFEPTANGGTCYLSCHAEDHSPETYRRQSP